MPQGYRNTFKPKPLVDELKSLSYNMYFKKELTPENYARLSQLAANLSSVLPKVSDTTIFEIDDIIYGEDNNNVIAGTNVVPQKTINYLVKNCYKPVLNLFTIGICKYDRFVEMAFLQLLEHVQNRTYKKVSRNEPFGAVRTIVDQIEMGSLEHFLKVLKVSLNSHKKIFVWHLQPEFMKDNEIESTNSLEFDKYFLIGLLLIFSLPEKCKSENQNVTRKALWLSKQCSDILEIITTSNIVLNHDLRSYITTYKDEKKRYNYHFTWLLLPSMFKNIGMTFCSKHLLNYLSSAQNEDERSQRICNFITGAVAKNENLLTNICHIIEGLNFMPYFGTYTKRISDHIFKLFQQIRKYPSSTMKKLEQRCGFDVTSYLLNDADCSTYLAFKEEAVDLVEKYFKKSNISEFVAKSEEAEFGEELSLYHEFVNGLLIIDAIHITWLTMPKMIQVGSIHPGFFDEYFRPHDSPIKTSINELIADPTKRGRGDWWIQAILRKCPFLILSHDNKSHLENLMKLLIGRNVDKATEEQLYSVINMNLKAPTSFYCNQELVHGKRGEAPDNRELPWFPKYGSAFSTQPYSVHGRYVPLPPPGNNGSNPIIYFINSAYFGYYFHFP